MNNKYKELLEVGQIYKSYKQVCEALCEKVKTGKAKILQIEDWERYFLYSKDGNKFIIEEIYDEPIEKVDARKDGNSKVKYIEEIEKLILDLLLQKVNDGYSVFLSKNKLLESLMMINKNYSKGKWEINKLKNYTNVPIEEINDFYSSSDSMLQRHLEKALNNLRNKSLIIWKPTLTVAHIETDAIINLDGEVAVEVEEELTAYGDIKVNYNAPKLETKLVHREATAYEESVILDIEFETLQRYKCASISEIYKKGLSNNFYNDVNHRLRNWHNIHCYYNSYEISFNPEDLQNKIELLEKLESKEREATQQKLNDSIKEQISRNSYNRYENAISKENKKEIHNVRANEKYVDNSNVLIKRLIDIHTECIF